MRSLASIAALSLALAVAPRAADAGKVIVLAVQGDHDGELEDGLSAIVEDRHDLVTSKQVERAARKQHLDDLDGPSLGKIAHKLGADAVVDGSMTREEDGYLFVVRIRAASGKTVKKISLDLPRRKLSAKARKRLGTGVLDGIDKVLGIESDERISDDSDGDDDGGDDGMDDRQARHKARGEARAIAANDRDDDDGDSRDARDSRDDRDRDDDRGDREDDRGDRVAARDDDGDGGGGGDDVDVGVHRHATHESRRSGGAPAVILSVGPSATMRTLAFTSRADFTQAPLGYKSSLVPGARIAGEIYPLAAAGKGGALAGLGLGGEFDKTLQLTTRSSDAPDVALKTNQEHWQIDARYRFHVGSPEVTLIGGYGRRAFIVDRSSLPMGDKLDMPDVDYRYFDPGAMIRFPVGSRLAVYAGAQAMLVRAAGYIQRQSSYGGAKVTGVDARAGFQLKVGKSLMAEVAGGFTQIGFVFVGNGQETNNRDLDPTTQDVGGASDRYVNVMGTLGYTY